MYHTSYKKLREKCLVKKKMKQQQNSIKTEMAPSMKF